MNSTPEITILIIYDGNYAALVKCVKTWLNYSYKNINIVIGDTTKTHLKFDLPNVSVLEKHISKTEMLNLLISNTKTKYFLVTSMYVIPLEKTLHHLIATIVLNKNVAAVSPNITHAETSYFGTKVSENSYNTVITKDCVLIKKYDYDLIGEFDTNFKGVLEDVEWSVRARKIGYNLAYCYYSKCNIIEIPNTSKFLETRSKFLMISLHDTKLNKFLAFSLGLINPFKWRAMFSAL